MPSGKTPKSPETKARMAEARRQWWASRTEEEKRAYSEKQQKPHPKTSLALKGRKQKRQRRGKGEYYPCGNSECGNSVYRMPYQIEEGINRFCSKECYLIWRRQEWDREAEEARSVYI